MNGNRRRRARPTRRRKGASKAKARSAQGHRLSSNKPTHSRLSASSLYLPSSGYGSSLSSSLSIGSFSDSISIRLEGGFQKRKKRDQESAEFISPKTMGCQKKESSFGNNSKNQAELDELNLTEREHTRPCVSYSLHQNQQRFHSSSSAGVSFSSSL